MGACVASALLRRVLGAAGGYVCPQPAVSDAPIFFERGMPMLLAQIMIPLASAAAVLEKLWPAARSANDVQASNTPKFIRLASRSSSALSTWKSASGRADRGSAAGSGSASTPVPSHSTVRWSLVWPIAIRPSSLRTSSFCRDRSARLRVPTLC